RLVGQDQRPLGNDVINEDDLPLCRGSRAAQEVSQCRPLRKAVRLDADAGTNESDHDLWLLAEADPGQPMLGEPSTQCRDDFPRKAEGPGDRLGRLAGSQTKQDLGPLPPGRLARAYNLLKECTFVRAELDRHGATSPV